MSERGSSNPCPYMQAGPDCSQSYADMFGATYDWYQAVLACLAFFLLVIATVQTARVVRRKGWRPLDLQKTVHLLVILSSATLLVRSAVDPEGWRTIYPEWVVYLLSDLSNASLFSVFFSIVHVWVLAITRGYPTQHIRVAFHFAQVFLWVFAIGCGQAREWIGPAWIWSAMKLIGTSTLLSFMCALATFTGLRIYWTLSANFADPTSALPAAATTTAASAESASRMALQDRAERRAMVDKVVRVLVVADLLAAIVIVFMVGKATFELEHRYDPSANPSPPPTLSQLIFHHAIFALLQWAVSVSALIMFRVHEGAAPPRAAPGAIVHPDDVSGASDDGERFGEGADSDIHDEAEAAVAAVLADNAETAATRQFVPVINEEDESDSHYSATPSSSVRTGTQPSYLSSATNPTPFSSYVPPSAPTGGSRP